MAVQTSASLGKGINPNIVGNYFTCSFHERHIQKKKTVTEPRHPQQTGSHLEPVHILTVVVVVVVVVVVNAQALGGIPFTF
jgi:hypothetical protein